MTAGDRSWRREHGISDEVWGARGYIRYGHGEHGAIRSAFRAADCAPNQLRWAESMGARSAGLIMPAHALPLPELGLRPIPPQLRPDQPIERRPVLHYHPDESPPSGTVVSFDSPETGQRKVVDESRWSTAWAMRRHIVGAHGKDLAAELGCKTPTELHHLCTAPDCRDDLARVLAEANDREPHQHESRAKYLLTITPRKPLAHNHADYVRPDWRQRHIRKHHSGIEVVGAHIHDGAKFDRVTMEDDDPRMSPGRRIDALPLSWELLPRAEVVYFVMEGKIKADAALSCILDLGLAASVVDVPSVGQWEALELDELCNHLTGKTIVIVVDSDADGNDQVMTQGIRLRSLGSSDTACALA